MERKTEKNTREQKENSREETGKDTHTHTHKRGKNSKAQEKNFLYQVDCWTFHCLGPNNQLTFELSNRGPCSGLSCSTPSLCRLRWGKPQRTNRRDSIGDTLNINRKEQTKVSVYVIFVGPECRSSLDCTQRCFNNIGTALCNVIANGLNW